MKRLKEIAAFIGSLFESSYKDNWKVVLLCVITATTFWFFNALNSGYDTRIYYPIEFEFDPTDVVIVRKLPERIEINVSGGGWNLLRKTLPFTTSPIIINLDNPTERKLILGSSLVPTIAEQVNELTLNYVVTDTLEINIERKIRKKFPLEVDSAGIDLAPAFRIVSAIYISTDSIELEGPQSYIEAAPERFMLELPDDRINRNYEEQIPLRVENAGLVYVRPEEVTVSFEVAQFQFFEKEIEVTPINFPSDSRLSLQEEQIIVSFWADRKYQQEVEQARFRVVADFKKMDRSDSTIAPQIVQNPSFANDIAIEPFKISLHYTPQEEPVDEESDGTL